jgi:hypothetical protein
MSKELQELRNQGRGEDHSTSATESLAETSSSSMQDEGIDDFRLSPFTVNLKGVIINSSVATEAYIVYVHILLPLQYGVAYRVPDSQSTCVRDSQLSDPFRPKQPMRTSLFCSGQLSPLFYAACLSNIT